MNNEWLLYSAADEEELARKYKISMSNPAIGVANILYKLRPLFDRLDERVKRKTGVPDFDSMFLALNRVLEAGQIEDVVPRLRPAKEAVITCGRNEKLSYYGSRFNYGQVDMGDWADYPFTLFYPVTFVHDDMLDDFLELRGSRYVLEGNEWLAYYNHDWVENCFKPALISENDKSFENGDFIRKNFGMKNITEPFVVALHHIIQEELFAEDPAHEMHVIQNTVRYIDLVRKVVKENADVKESERPKLAKFWLNRHFSMLFYNTPARKFLNNETDVDGKQRSIASAMQDYGFSYEVTAAKILTFCTERKVPLDRTDFTNTAELVEHIANKLEAGHFPEHYTLYGLKFMAETLRGKQSDSSGNITLTGLEAFRSVMLLEGDLNYDLSHFWAGEFTKMFVLPPGHEGMGEGSFSIEKDFYKAMHKKLDAPNKIVLMEPEFIAARYFDVMLESAEFFSGPVRERAGQVAEYLKRQPSNEMRDHMLPKIHRMQEREVAFRGRISRLGGSDSPSVQVMVVRL